MAKLVITIDTEEEGIWEGKYKAKGNSVKHLRNIPKLQQIFDKYNVKPTYLLDYPVLCDRESVKIFKKIKDKCELGTHLHTWCTPPFEEEINPKNTFACNLDFKLVERKLRSLTEKFKDVFGFSPKCFKSGRYGIDSNQIKILTKLGYKADTSITPFLSHEKFGGHNFINAPYKPYFPSFKNVLKEDRKNELLELPATIGFNLLNFEFARKIYFFIEKLPFSGFLIGGLNKLRILQRLFLSPEQSPLNELKKISNVYIKKGIPVLHLSFHSQNIIADGTPYVKGEEGVMKFFRKLDIILDYLVNKKKVESVGCLDYKNYLK